MGWFGPNFWFFPFKMVTFKIKDELDECIYFEVIYFQKKSKKRPKCGRTCFVCTSQFWRWNCLLRPFLGSRRFAFKTKFVDEPWHMPKSLLARMMQYLYRSSSRCTKLISVAKTLQNTFIDAKLVVDLKCKPQFKSLKKVVNSTFGAKNAQNQVFPWYKKSNNFCFRNAWHGVVHAKSWFGG